MLLIKYQLIVADKMKSITWIAQLLDRLILSTNRTLEKKKIVRIDARLNDRGVVFFNPALCQIFLYISTVFFKSWFAIKHADMCATKTTEAKKFGHNWYNSWQSEVMMGWSGQWGVEGRQYFGLIFLHR